MREIQRNNTKIIEYDSINDFFNYISLTKTNETFSRAECRSKVVNRERDSFTHTHTFEEATELLKHGWTEKTTELEQKFKDKRKAVIPATMRKNIIDVQGYQCVVPLYLMDVPQNMISTKITPVKKKVITLDKNISYASHYSVNEIMEESIKALQIVNAYEGKSFRCNLNIVFGVRESIFGGSSKQQYVIKIKIKSSNERLNLSKMTFPLVHPSMLRRLIFRWIEVYPEITRGYIGTYGTPLDNGTLYNIFKDEYLLPTQINKDVTKLQTLDDLKKI